MPKGRPLTPLSISAEDRAQLVVWSKRPKTAQALAMRSRIVLLAGEGLSDSAIASQLHTMQRTVGKWRRRYLGSGLDGLLDEQRPGTSRKLRDQDVDRVLALNPGVDSYRCHALVDPLHGQACGTEPCLDSSHLASLFAGSASLRDVQVIQDPLFIDKVRDIVGLYLAPPEPALVLCVDEKSQIQALDRSAPLLPMRPGQIERRKVWPKR